MPERRSAIPVLLVASLLALPLAGAAHAYSTGVGDQQTEMFGNPLWTQLKTRIVRYIAPYDAAVRADELAKASLWIGAATAAHQQILVAFYHSEHTPTRMPSLAAYRRDVAKFVRHFPQIKQYQAWNEANRGNVRHMFSSPTPAQAAAYYKTLRSVCPGCQVTGLDILDQSNYRPTLTYISQFRAALHQLHVPTPTLWGLHNYSDTNRFSGIRTRAILRAAPGQFWLTETGGIVQFGRGFRNHNGSGDTRAARALSFMFSLASSNPRITRLYIFQWSGASAQARFDAGLLDTHYVARPGYVIVCRHVGAAKCTGLPVDSKH